jgi:hypothetical protein
LCRALYPDFFQSRLVLLRTSLNQVTRHCRVSYPILVPSSLFRCSSANVALFQPVRGLSCYHGGVLSRPAVTLRLHSSDSPPRRFFFPPRFFFLGSASSSESAAEGQVDGNSSEDEKGGCLFLDDFCSIVSPGLVLNMQVPRCCTPCRQGRPPALPPLPPPVHQQPTLLLTSTLRLWSLFFFLLLF